MYPASMAGYSGTPLVKKLGIKPGARVATVNAPATFATTLGDLPEETALATSLAGKKPFDVIVWFVLRRAILVERLDATRARLTPAGGLWIAWPKKASKVVTDVTEDVIRAVALPTGLVDNKVCAVDETWSGLRLVVRLAHRER